MVILRKVVFYLFTLIYLVTCPVLILYALGFIYKPGSELGVVKTGLISVLTVPDGAHVYLGKRRYTDKTPAVVRDLLPGPYHLRIERKGYKTWSQRVIVEGEKASVLDHILLIPEQWNQETLLAERFDRLIFIPDMDYLILGNDQMPAALHMYDFRRKEASVMPEGQVSREDEVTDIWVGRGNASVLIRLKRDDMKRLMILEPDHPRIKTTELPAISAKTVEQVWFPENRKDSAFILQGGILSKVSLKEIPGTLPFFDDIIGAGVTGSHVYALNRDGTLLRRRISGGSATAVGDPDISRTLFSSGEFYAITELDSDLVLFTSSDGELLSNRLPYRMLAKEVRGFEYHKQTRQLLVWTDEAAGVFDFSDRRTHDDQLFERGPKLTWLLKDRHDIRRAFWVYEGSHVLIQDGDNVILTSYAQDYRQAEPRFVTRIREDTDVFYSEKSGWLYYLERDSGYLRSLEILPKRILLDLTLPETLDQPQKSGTPS